jgi:hypothetical protein
MKLLAKRKQIAKEMLAQKGVKLSKEELKKI